MDDEAVFRALADDSRRLLLDRLFERDGQTLTELDQALPSMTRFGVMKHLRVLEAASLVTTRRVGREKHHYLNPVPIRRIHDRWLDKYRMRAADALNDLKAFMEAPTMLAPHESSTAAPPAAVFTVFIRTTPDQLWRAITDSEFTTRYYYRSAVESDWNPGAGYRYHIDGADQITGTVIEADPPRKLVQTFDARWDEDVAADAPTRISWEIEEAGPGMCRLTVVHDGFASRTATYESVVGGMPYILSGLKTLLETGSPLAG
ncbi:MAG TPA: SRPBCC domain-containing protein [Candidatus Limnocylindrales bacterium]|jgi:uncharacterized protein YndB with AHSA1/START domain/DNA-binding transcriptional ArsR family regulator